MYICIIFGKYRLQNERLKILTQVIKKREEENEKYNNERLAKIWQKKLQEKNELQEKLQKRMVKAVRKLTNKRKSLNNKVQSRDIINEYTNYGSRVYAPITREGRLYEQSQKILEEQKIVIKDFRELEKLEAVLPSSVINPKISLPENNEIKNSNVARK
eukprot:jgi/Orpsp1_1/1174195/evm.model.c7180000049212.2